MSLFIPNIITPPQAALRCYRLKHDQIVGLGAALLHIKQYKCLLVSDINDFIKTFFLFTHCEIPQKLLGQHTYIKFDGCRVVLPPFLQSITEIIWFVLDLFSFQVSLESKWK